MSCTTRSRLTNVTRPPAATVASYGIMPNGVMVTVVASGGGAGAGAGAGVGAGEGGDATLDGAWLAGADRQRQRDDTHGGKMVFARRNPSLPELRTNKKSRHAGRL
jgi:hypothetical protein